MGGGRGAAAVNATVAPSAATGGTGGAYDVVFTPTVAGAYNLALMVVTQASTQYVTTAFSADALPQRGGSFTLSGAPGAFLSLVADGSALLPSGASSATAAVQQAVREEVKTAAAQARSCRPCSA